MERHVYGWRFGGMMTDGEKPNYLVKKCPIATMFTTNPTQTAVGIFITTKN
jgi:hypothetical protein